jgi:hypothetical protein
MMTQIEKITIKNYNNTNMKHISFPSIEQFRNVVGSVNRQYNFVGLDENGEAIYDSSLPKPVLTFKGTVKLHGTNAGVCFNDVDGMWYQSRENIITPEKDNAGFAFFADANKEQFASMFAKIAERSNIDTTKNTISIYGEWCGGNIQKGVAICNLPKSFFIFGVKVTPHHIEGVEKQPSAYWVDYTDLKNNEAKIYNIDDFETYSLDIDFNMPELIQNKLGELTLAVEEECPVGKAFGFSGIGEGIVWSCELKGNIHRFKVKGEQHSSSKVKKLASVDTEKITSIKEFVDYVVTESRFNQAIEKIFPNNEPVDVKKLGEVIKWVVNDIIKEETDTLVQNNLEPKDIGKYVSNKVREMFFKLPV